MEARKKEEEEDNHVPSVLRVGKQSESRFSLSSCLAKLHAWLPMCCFINCSIINLILRASVPDTPLDTSADGEIQLNQRTLDAIIQGVTAKLQEAAKPPEASPGPLTGESGVVHIASGVQLAPRHIYPAQYTKAAGRQVHRAQTWDSKWLAGCNRPQAVFISSCSVCKDHGGPKQRAGGL